MTSALKVKMKFPNDKELKDLFGSVDVLQRFNTFDAAVKAGAKAVELRAAELAPVGTEEDRRKRSKSQRAKADWDGKRLRDTISHVVRKGDTGAYAVIGPTWPRGNKAYFNQPKSGTRKQVLWGKMTRLRPYIAARNWMVQAFDESKDKALSAMKQAVRNSIDKVMRG